MTDYSRENPSPRFRELVGYYQEMHVHGAVDQNIPAAETFDGRSLPKHAANIETIISVLGSRTILDYGSGKGKQYEPGAVNFPAGMQHADIRSYWNVETITCYDPGYEPFSTLPSGTFDGVVSTDVLEHCPKEDIPWLIDEIFAFARDFVYLNVACYPASKTLPNGENAHCTLEPPEWWSELFSRQVAEVPGLRWFAAYDVPQPDGKGGQNIEMVIHRGRWDN